MIDWTQTNHVWSVERSILPASVSTIAEGQPLVSSVLNGLTYVTPSAGSTTQRLAGICMMPRRATTNLTRVTVTAPTGAGTVLLPNTVAAGGIGLYVASTYAQIAVSSSAASPTNVQSGTDSVTGLTSLTFDSTDAGYPGGQFYAVYNYTMTTFEQIARFGTYSPGPFASDMLSQTGVFRIGRIAVNNFSPTANWWGAADSSVKIIATGQFTDSGSGTGYVPTNVDVVQFPTTSYPWLVLEIH